MSDLVCDGPKFEETKFESNGARESANEEYPVIKVEHIAQATTRSRSQVDRHCLDCGHG